MPAIKRAFARRVKVSRDEKKSRQGLQISSALPLSMMIASLPDAGLGAPCAEHQEALELSVCIRNS
jgi:hypothetical protein